MAMRTFRIVSIAAIATGLAVTLGAQQPPPAGAAQGRGAGATAPAAGAQGGGRRGGGGRAAQAPNPNAVHVYIWAGPKTHPEGLHDYPQLLADWSKNQGEGLMMRGAIVDGSLHPPTAADLANTDVVIMYKGDAEVTMTPQQHADLEAYIKRGGGFVSIHDSLCVADTEWWANTVTGGAKKHGEQNFSAGMLHTTIVDKANPIMAGMNDFDMQEEAFMLMTWAKTPIHPLATVAMPGGAHKDEVVPQIWTYEHTLPGGQPARAFVYMQGHVYKDLSDPTIYPMLQRGIAWAAKKPLDALATVRGTGGGRGIGGSDIVVPPGGGAGRQ
jgi:type 1 glutamine amidotransferase